MDELKKLIHDVRNYCTDNDIEYVFAAIDTNNKYTKVSTNVETNVVLKKAVDILKRLL
jgi:hypothetical protein